MLRATLALALVACGHPPAPVAPPPPAPAPVVVKQVSLDGIWLGTLTAGRLRLQLHLSGGNCELDSLDQDAMAIPCDHVVATATELAFEVPSVKASLKGAVSADGNTVTATFVQGGAELPLVLTRQTVALEPAKPKLDPPMDPVVLEQLQPVLDADFAPLVAGSLAPATGVGVTIGVIAHGQRRIFSYGSVKPDSLFEIGSITKTFTGLVLAQMSEQKKVRLDEPVRALLPKGTVPPSTGAEITLLDLSAQRSGLPRMPDNFKPADRANPYADYDAKALYAYVAAHGLAMPASPEFGYSNLGVGLLGQALANRAGTTYEALLRKEVTGPLGMRDTVIAMPTALASRFAAGHAEGNRPQRAWDLGSLAGAGGIRSTAADMLIYLDAQLHPDHVKGKSAEANTLPTAIAISQMPRAEAMPGMHIALNWFRVDESGIYWHDGATGGFSSYAMFDPPDGFAIVVLCNRSVDDGALANDVGMHVAQRMLGKPAHTVGP